MTYEEILSLSAGLLNDSERAEYTDLVMLPYLNIARLELEQIFELNDIPVVDEQSAVINVPLGEDSIVFGGTPPVPSLPTDLVEIQRVWESQEGINNYTPVTKVTYLPPPTNTEISFFGVFAWNGQEIKVTPAIVDIDIKLDYIRSFFTFLEEDDLEDANSILNTSLYFVNRVAGLCAEFIMHDTERAMSLNSNAGGALNTSIGISVKGMQTIVTRRRPFRAGYKARRGRY